MYCANIYVGGGSREAVIDSHWAVRQECAQDRLKRQLPPCLGCSGQRGRPVMPSGALSHQASLGSLGNHWSFYSPSNQLLVGRNEGCVTKQTGAFSSFHTEQLLCESKCKPHSTWQVQNSCPLSIKGAGTAHVFAGIALTVSPSHLSEQNVPEPRLTRFLP